MLYRPLVADVEFHQLSQPQQVAGVADTFGGALGCQLAVFPKGAGQLQFLEMVLQEQRGSVAHQATLPSDSRVR